MAFLNHLWRKFKMPTPSHSGNEIAETVLEHSTPTKTSSAPQEKILSAYEEIETENLQREMAIDNLKTLENVVNKSEETLGLRFANIQKTLNTPESYETVRQERWHEGIVCPNCQSKELKRLPHLTTQSPHNHRYRCLACDFEFNDGTGTPLEGGIPPINIWMQCWYLMGCTDSLHQIAVRLNLDLGTVEWIARQLRMCFNATKPLTHTLDFDEWNAQSKDLYKQLSEDLIKQYELLNANVATAPKDTTEFRRQQNLRRTLNATTEPPPPTTTPTTKKRPG